MPSSWERIPKELLEAIFDQIKEDEVFLTRIRKRCLFQVMLTCKHWSGIAKEVFYNEHFTIDLKTARKLTKGNTNQRLFLKNIEVTSELANNAAFTTLLSRCPDITKLSIQQGPCTTAPNIYMSLFALSRSKYLSQLQKVEYELDRAREEQLLVHHQQAMLQLRPSLTYLNIVDSTKPSSEHPHMKPPAPFVKWFDQLKDFPRLASVKVNVSTLASFYEMDRFIQKMGSNVTDISITMNYSNVPQPLESLNLAAITRRQAFVESLKIEMALLRIDDLRYIAHKFSSLSYLQIDLWGVAYGEDPAPETLNLSSTQSAKALAEFFEYLTSLSKFLITNVRMDNRHLRQALVDLKKCFQVSHLTLCNILQTSSTSKFSIKCLSKARNGQRGRINLDLEVGTEQLLSVAKLAYEVLGEDVVKLQFGGGLVEHYDDDYNDREFCYTQGDAVILGISLLPSIKTLTATNPGIDSLAPIVNSKTPKLALDLLNLGSFIDLDILFELSQRVKFIGRWVAPDHADWDDMTMTRQHYVLNMPFTTFGEIDISSRDVSRFIIKLSTSSSTTFHGVGLSRDKQLPTEEDYYAEEDDEYPEEYDYQASLDNIGKVTIVCADVKKLKIDTTACDTTRFLILLLTSSTSTCHKVGFYDSDYLEYLTEEDFNNEIENIQEDDDADRVGTMIIGCFDVKKLRVGGTLVIDRE
ncbi:hypothetical protein MBANPS3_002787 [Mucor bainieri]